MIRFYYILFQVEDNQWHNGFTPNKFHLSIFLKDRIWLIVDEMMNDPTFEPRIGYIDADNSAKAITALMNQYPECVLTGDNFIEYYTIHYNDKPVCFTQNEMEYVDDYQDYFGYYRDETYDGYSDMDIFNAVWTIQSIASVFFKRGSSIMDCIIDASNRIAWYAIILLNLYSHASDVGDFSDTFKSFMNDIFRHRGSTLQGLNKHTCYHDIHDIMFDYHRSIIGDSGVINPRQKLEYERMYERFLDIMADDSK